jgi:hypothetical protein
VKEFVVKTTPKKKLKLNKQSLRRITSEAIRVVVGAGYTTKGGYPCPCPTPPPPTYQYTHCGCY